MATGYNATSRRDLTEQYADYKSNDWDDGDYEEGEETQWDIWNNKMTLEQKLDFIRDDEFDIERSFLLPFEDND